MERANRRGLNLEKKMEARMLLIHSVRLYLAKPDNEDPVEVAIFQTLDF